MQFLSNLAKRLSRIQYRPLIYDEDLRQAYSSVSVCGGKLKGKTAVVTGATGGIGCATARRLIDEGCNVILTGKNEEKLLELKDILKKDCNSSSVTYKIIDNTQPSTFCKVVDEIFDNRRVDLWVNCAGIFKKTDRSRVFRDLSEETYNEVITVNLASTIKLCDLVANKMMSCGVKGRIINISSICGLTNHFGYTPYGISKTALIEYTKLYADKYKNKVEFLSLSPGSVATRMGTRYFGGDISGTNGNTSHVAIPEEIAAVICFLAGEAGMYLNGQNIISSAAERV